MNRTPASATNRKTWTWSAWVKRGTLGSFQYIYGAGGGSNDSTLAFYSDDTFACFLEDGAGGTGIRTTQVFRDPSAWYHIVLVLDTTQATSSNRMKLYVNGSQVTAFGTASYPTQNTDWQINNTAAHNLGRARGGSYFDGYMAEVNFIDGQGLTTASFGEFDTTTGVWKPKRYTGTYGTNGFYLPFTDIATTSGSNAGLGKDFSGNGNYWTTNNISVTAGSTYDSMTDVPTLTSATAANWCTLNPLDRTLYSGSPVFSNGNLRASSAGGSTFFRPLPTIIPPTSGKWYYEATQTTVGDTGQWIGWYGFAAYRANGDGIFDYNNWGAYGASFTNGDVIGVALDFDANTVTFYKNGTSQGSRSAYAAGKGDAQLASIASSAAAAIDFNFGQQGFKYTPPTGFKALNTYNLPDSTIVAGNKVMDATTYTGNGSSLTVTNAGAFKPDLVWVKRRNNSAAHRIGDSVRGITNSLYSSSTSTEVATDGNGYISAITSTGFTVTTGSTDAQGTNFNGDTYVGWQWKAGQSAGSSNTNGSITSTVSVNAAAGFSVATYAGTGANATVGHGLGVAPKFVIVKNRSVADDWCVYHASSGAANYGQLNLGGAFGANSTIWNNTAPTSSVFSVGTYLSKSGSNYVAYCWSEIEGFSKMGSYTGNGSTDGPFVYTGFRPKFILTKRTDATSDWWIQDTSRATYNASNALLFPNLANAEYTTAGVEFDILSNGFKPRNTGHNISSGTYIYVAFAEVPFKNSLGR
jgi:hypothetical protein